MHFTQLTYFHTVCRFLSISRAAEHLHISQPSLSAAIKDLESTFGVSLFKRHHKGVTLTAEGEILYKMSGDILSRAKDAEDIMRDLGNGRKTLKLGIPPMICSLVLPCIFGEFLPQNPDISIEITEGGYNELLQKLQENYLDAVFLPHQESFDTSLSSLLLGELELVCCAHKNHPVATLSVVTPHALQQTPIVLFENGFFQTAKIKQWFEKDGIAPHILLQTEQLSTAQTVVSNNLAVGFMFRQILAANPDVVSVPLQNEIREQISVVYKKADHTLSSVKNFATFMQQRFLFK